MKISRRDFLKWTVATAVALKVQLDFDKLNTVLAADTDPPVIWLQGAGCTGCTVSVLNVTNPATIDDVLTNKISMKFDSTIMAPAGDLAMQSLSQAAAQYNGQFILVVEGAIPTGNNNYCVIGEENGVKVSIRDAVLKYGPMAKYVVAAGTCAAFGGIPAAAPNDTSCTTVKTLLSGLTVNPVVNLPGCPTHPTVFVQTLIDLILKGVPSLDSYNQPPAYYSTPIHQNCPRRGAGQVKQPGQTGCLKAIGCKGQTTRFICPTLMWNNGLNFCNLTNYPCMGCSNPTFPTNPLTK
jgi:hydrogenase small subunit